MSKSAYTKKYFEEIVPGSIRSAEAIIPVIKEFIMPASVADFGCGTGAWLKTWKKNGVDKILGIDGVYVDKEKLLINKECFITADLQKEFLLPEKYELVMSLEVAEHLKEEYAPVLIQTLCRAGNIVLFSAAIPYQDGVDHFNEQFPSYWIDLFRKHCFSPYDCIREKIWDITIINICYRQNILFFIHDDFKDHYPLITKQNRNIFSIVHPEQYELKQRELSAYRKILRTPFHANLFFIKKYAKIFLTKIGLWK